MTACRWSTLRRSLGRVLQRSGSNLSAMLLRFGPTQCSFFRIRQAVGALDLAHRLGPLLGPGKAKGTMSMRMCSPS